MKLTKTRLKQIIKEEMQALLKEEGDTVPYIGTDNDNRWSTKEMAWEEVLPRLKGNWVRYQGQPVQVGGIKGNTLILAPDDRGLSRSIDRGDVEGWAVKAVFLTSPTWDDALNNPGSAVGER
jgi:hypothetical protein